MKPLYIFDLDGTLALIDHRRPILDNKDNPNRWDDFYRACVDDKPNLPVITLFKQLKKPILDEMGYIEEAMESDVLIFSGRSEIVFKETVKWLIDYTEFNAENCIEMLKMRPIGNSIPDEKLKHQWYQELSIEDKKRLVCVFDDRQKVVGMWRSLGVTCLQVAPGNF